MTKLQARPLWKCSQCDEVHEDEDDARECCMPEIYELWGCPECGKVHDEERQALECCEEYTRCPGCARDFGRGHINHFAIQLSGHCNVCVPFFTVEQQLIIEDRHSQYLGEPGPRLNS